MRIAGSAFEPFTRIVWRSRPMSGTRSFSPWWALLLLPAAGAMGWFAGGMPAPAAPARMEGSDPLAARARVLAAARAGVQRQLAPASGAPAAPLPPLQPPPNPPPQPPLTPPPSTPSD